MSAHRVRIVTVAIGDPTTDEESRVEHEEEFGLSRVPCRDESVRWRGTTWWVADVVTDLDAGEITVVLRGNEQT